MPCESDASLRSSRSPSVPVRSSLERTDDDMLLLLLKLAECYFSEKRSLARSALVDAVPLGVNFDQDGCFFGDYCSLFSSKDVAVWIRSTPPLVYTLPD